MSRRLTKLLLLDMLEAAKKIKLYTSGLNIKTFLDNDLVMDAVARNFEIIGEASGRIDTEYKKKNNNIDWIRITGFRNRIIHEYFGIDYSIMWTIITENIQDLINQLEILIVKENNK